ncbi:MAG TPA: hypothetical protein VN926_01860 [Bradyrhizobium sp.]|nr:hypothetical protein [Bradyrhizobium sp.]
MNRWIVGIAAAACVAIGFALAQPAGVPGLYLTSPTGAEQINVAGLGPRIETIQLVQARDAAGYTLVAAGTTVATTAPNTSSEIIAIGAITTWNLTLATAPVDGLKQRVSCPGGNTGTLTIGATLPTGVVIVGVNPTSCTESSALGSTFLYSLAKNTWYRVD